ncbi:MAG: PAS domain S-box protein [Thermodesulfovibrionales bacterium]|nr:PAS domain S-box protein [Thermodesulfovibrionales bacterium]
MSAKDLDFAILNPAAGTAEGITEVRRQEALLKTRALQNAIFNSANLSSIATDAKGVIQLFNVGAERMLGYTAAEVMNKLFLCTALNTTESLRFTREDQK